MTPEQTAEWHVGARKRGAVYYPLVRDHHGKWACLQQLSYRTENGAVARAIRHLRSEYPSVGHALVTRDLT